MHAKSCLGLDVSSPVACIQRQLPGRCSPWLLVPCQRCERIRTSPLPGPGWISKAWSCHSHWAPPARSCGHNHKWEVGRGERTREGKGKGGKEKRRKSEKAGERKGIDAGNTLIRPLFAYLNLGYGHGRLCACIPPYREYESCTHMSP